MSGVPYIEIPMYILTQIIIIINNIFEETIYCNEFMVGTAKTYLLFGLTSIESRVFTTRLRANSSSFVITIGTFRRLFPLISSFLKCMQNASSNFVNVIFMTSFCTPPLCISWIYFNSSFEASPSLLFFKRIRLSHCFILVNIHQTYFPQFESIKFCIVISFSSGPTVIVLFLIEFWLQFVWFV